MKIGDNIASAGSVLLPGITVGYNGTDFDLLRTGPGDSVDANPVQTAGILRVLSALMGFNGTTFDRIRTIADNADANAALATGLIRCFSENALFNGTSFDRQRGNLDNISLAALSAASASGNSPDQTNFNGRGLKVVINITALTGTSPTITFNVQGKDPVSGQYFNMLTSTALNATGLTVLSVYPAITTSANLAVSDILPRTWRLAWTIGGTTPAVTATAGGIVLV